MKWYRQKSAEENAWAALWNLLQLMNVPVTMSSARQTLLSNYSYPSLSSVAESLDEWNIENMTVKISSSQLADVEFPCIAYLSSANGKFIVITAYENNTVSYVDPETGPGTEPISSFEKKWNGILLLAQKTEKSGEPDFLKKKRHESGRSWKSAISGILLLIGFSSVFIQDHSFNISFYAILTLKLTGLVTSVILLLHYLKPGNSLLQQVCAMGNPKKKSNCHSVLDSPASKIFGIPFADIGACYFAGGVLSIFFSLMNNNAASTMNFLSLINLTALPFILFSVFYQAAIIRQWCKLCIAVQLILLLEFITGNITETISLSDFTAWTSVLPGFLLPLSLWMMIRQSILNSGRFEDIRIKYERIKNNPHAFKARLSREKAVALPDDIPYAVSFGPAEAAVTVTMVSHPQCSMCALTHQYLHELTEQFPETLRYLVLFYCPDNNLGYKIASTIIYASMEEGQERIHEVMSEGYRIKNESEYAAWSGSYNADKDQIKKAMAIVAAQTQWVKPLQVKGTPFFLVNNKRIPDGLSIYDLKPFIRITEEEKALADLAAE